jgi:hypothetical protein
MIPGLMRQCVLLSLLVLLTATACNSSPQFVEVSGVVKLDGKPMPDAVVEFLPDPAKGTRGPRASGTTDGEGRFRLVRDDEQDGAVVGFHRVLIQDARTFPPARHLLPGGKMPVMPPSRISARYANATDTPLRQEVKAGSQTITLELTSK